MTHKEILLHWIDCFNQKKLEELLALYDEQAEHYSPKLKLKHPETLGLVKGKAAFRTWWKEAFDTMPTLNYKLNYSIIEGDRIFFEYLRTVEGQENMIVGECFVIKNEKIISSKVFHS